MRPPPHIPETAPFTLEQRAWLNGFLAGLLSHDAPDPAVSWPREGASAKPAEPLLILFGSQMGTAEGLARRVAREAEQRAFAPRVLPLNDYEQANLAQARQAIIISSTWGDGDPPDNAAQFWSWLNSNGAPRLENLRFAVLGLGDRNYSDFCGASRKFDSRLEALGASRLVPRGECDVDYESAARSWLDGLWEQLGRAIGPAARSLEPRANLVVNGYHAPNSRNGAPAPRYGKSNPFPARLLRNVLLNKPGSAKEVRHYELSLEGSGLTYEVGDALGVMPSNCPELVDRLLAALRLPADQIVEVEGISLPWREALTRHFDITRPSPELPAAVAKAAPDGPLAALLAPERAADLQQWLRGRDLLDLVRDLPAPFSVPELLPMLRKLAPRLYSISSSPKAHPDEVHLTVSAVRFECLGRARKGVASTFLADRLGEAGSVSVYLQPSPGFKLPLNGDTPIIMIGPGTGIAPFRAFLEERQSIGAKGSNWLFFGDQQRATDFLYEDQLTAWLKDGHLTRLELAFSRDQAEKVYVQDRMLENAAELWSWLETGAHVYVCGDAARMARDVEAVLHRIVEAAGGKTADEAKAYLTTLKSEKRYQRDVY